MSARFIILKYYKQSLYYHPDEGISEFRELLSKEEVNAKLICYKPSEPLDSFFFQTLDIGKYKALLLIVQTRHVAK